MRSVHVRKKVKRELELKIDTDNDNFTHMQLPLKGRNTKACMWGEVSELITPIKFDIDRFRGLLSLGM